MDKKDGQIVEEAKANTYHDFKDGKFLAHYNDLNLMYTGRFKWIDGFGKETRWYTSKTAPKWLKENYEIAVFS